MRTQHILVPLDLVRGPATALAAVQKMTDDAPLRLTLLHVINLNIFPPPQQTVLDELRAECQAALRRLARLFFGAEQDVRIVVRFGCPAAEIISEAKESGADLVVMSGPIPGRTRFLRRGTTQRVLSGACCPVLVLPHPGITAGHAQRNAPGLAPRFHTATPQHSWAA